MSWATEHVKKLQDGETVKFRPTGKSMEPKINSGDSCTVSPELGDLKKNDIVLCKVKGRHYLHLIQAVQKKLGGTLYQIGNNKNFTNGWIMESEVFGKLIKVEK